MFVTGPKVVEVCFSLSCATECVTITCLCTGSDKGSGH